MAVSSGDHRSDRILLVTSNFPPVRGGSASVYANLARRLGDRVIVLAPTHDYADDLPHIGWRECDRLAPHKTRRLRLLRTTLGAPKQYRNKWTRRVWDIRIRMRVLGEVIRAVLKENVRTICIGELIASGWIAQVLRHFRSIKTVIYVHGEEITTADPHDPSRKRIRALLRAADKIVVVSQFTQTVTQALLGRGHEDKVVLIQNGVDVARFKSGKKSPDLLDLYRLHDKFVFVSVSRLVEKKGLDHAIRAFPAVASEYPDCRLLLVGSGPYEKALAAIVQDLGLQDFVRFAGSVPEDELVSHYQLGDVFVMPNRALPDGDTEGFGLVFLEANSCGVPVIAGMDGGSLEAVEHGVNGIVVDGRSLEQISRAMLSLRSDPKLRRTLREGGLQRAAASDWDSRVKLFEAVCFGPRSYPDRQDR